jgi:hypothetical protein
VQIPDETVRRHALRLAAAGVCAGEPGRIAFADADFATAEWRAFLHENAIAVQRMFAGLAERGVVDVWDKLVALGPDRSEGAA